MATQANKVRFIMRFREEFPHCTREECVQAAGALLRLSKRHLKLQIDRCTSPSVFANLDEWHAQIERREANLRARIKAVCDPFAVGWSFARDPRVATVKLHFVDETVAVPQ